MSVSWDGITLTETINDDWLAVRMQLADLAKVGNWNHALTLLESNPDLINTCRPGGKSLFAPLHQAAYFGASKQVVQRLLDTGAWRTLQNARGERAVDVAQRQGHSSLLPILEPVLKHHIPAGVLLQVQKEFHKVIRGRAEDLLQEHQLRLPELEPLLELETPEMWFPVPGMYGGFRFMFESFGVEAKLISESWCRVAGGSGQRHEITSRGSQMVAEGFV